MGCVSSKFLQRKKDAIAKQQQQTADSCNASSSNHYVYLTSTSYGLLNVGSPPPKVVPEKRSRSDARGNKVSSSTLTEMYCKLSSLQMDPDQKNVCDKVVAMASPSSSAAAAEVAAMSETIDVGDMMMGLEEPAMSYCASPPAKKVCPIAMEPLSVNSTHNHCRRQDMSMTNKTVKKNNNDGTTPNSALRETNLNDSLIDLNVRNGATAQKKHTTTRPFCNTVKFGADGEEYCGKEINTKATNGSAEESRSRRKRRGNPLDPVSCKRESHGSNVCTKRVMMKYSSELMAVKEEEGEEESYADGGGTPVSVNQPARRRSRGYGTISEPGSPLFDPDLVASYEAALENLQEQDWYRHGSSNQRADTVLGFRDMANSPLSLPQNTTTDVSGRLPQDRTRSSNCREITLYSLHSPSAMDVPGRLLLDRNSRGIKNVSFSLENPDFTMGATQLHLYSGRRRENAGAFPAEEGSNRERRRRNENTLLCYSEAENRAEVPWTSDHDGNGEDKKKKKTQLLQLQPRKWHDDDGKKNTNQQLLQLQQQRWHADGDGGKNNKKKKNELQQQRWSDGRSVVVLYTTTLRGIRKTYEDCNEVRRILVQELELRIDERDVSMHLEFLHELRDLMGGHVVSVPRLFIRGCYVGGIDHVRKLLEEGTLKKMVLGLPKDLSHGGSVCDGCGGVRFVPCLDCNGSCKIRVEQSKAVVRCSQCNENGLIHCPICCTTTYMNATNSMALED